MPQKKRVWILGAGFSRPLGGPLINDLLAFRERQLVAAALPPDVSEDALSNSVSARAFCAYGRAQGYWQDAEEFLAMVDMATVEGNQRGNDTHARRIVGEMLRGTVRFPVRVLDPGHNIPPSWREAPGPLHEFRDVGQLARATRLAVLADCWAFVRGANVDEDEAWLPYVKWARSLTGSDTILTFNYDPVPELLQEAGVGMSIIRPDQVETDLSFTRAKKTVAPVFKLHGSTTWSISGNSVVVENAGVPTSFFNPSATPLMGFPGPTKVQACRGSLKHLWTAALKTLREAEEVVFIGYRFPPTDAFSREQLLSALSDARRRQLTSIKTVLGDPSDPSSLRLSALLDAAAPGLHKPVPLLAQDFMDTEAIDSSDLSMFDGL